MIKKFWLYFLFLILFSSCKSEKQVIYDLVIKNGTVIHLDTGAVEQEDILISDGRIVNVLPSIMTSSYKSKKTIDAGGKYILPGFWDNHVHFRGGDSLATANKNLLKLFIVYGITTVRDAGGDLTPSVMEWKSQIAEGKLNGPTIYTSGPKIDGPSGTWAGSLEVESEADISVALDSLQQIPTDFVKLYDSRISGENYLNVIREAEKRKLITSGHMPFTVTLDETINAGIDAIEHLYYIMKGCSAKEREITARLENGEIGFWNAMPLLQESFDDNTAKKTFSSLRENKVFVVPTLHIGKVLSYLDETDHTADPFLKYMGAGIIKTYQGRIDRVLNSSQEAIDHRKKLDRFFGELTKSLNDAGVDLLAGSDCGAFNSFVYPGISLHRELEELVANGLSPLEALRTSAYNGSRLLEQETDYGTVDVNKVSDLVLLDADPLKDIENTKGIYMVIKGKTILDRESLQNLLKSAEQQ